MIGIAIQFTTCNLNWVKNYIQSENQKRIVNLFFFLFWIHIWSQHDGHLCMILLCNISHSLKKYCTRLCTFPVIQIYLILSLFLCILACYYVYKSLFWICRKLTNFTWIVNITFSFKLCTCTNISMGKNIQIWRFKKNINYILNCVIY